MSEFDPVADVEYFHRRFLQFYSGLPRDLPEDIQNFRINFMREEMREYENAVSSNDLEGALDALVDLAYVLLGTAHLHGFDFREAWRRVQVANMNKVLAKNADESKRGYRLDVVKPPGWVAPDHSDLVKRK
jgi:predicted HAD superfamily Cof-like phosphohydrolase